MKATHIVALAAVLAAGISAPALADWTNIGHVHFDNGADTSVAYSGFAGGVDSLQLTAHGSDVNCRNVRATFGNGSTRDIFTGRLMQGVAKFVNVPGDDRKIRRLDFVCRTSVRGGANVDIGADLSHHRDEWRRDPTWARLLGAMTPPPPPPVRGQDWNNPDHWVLLGSESFGGGMDHQSAFSAWGGRHVTEIALKPVDGDARCAHVAVWFANKQRAQLDVNADDWMKQGHFYRLDLPGADRNVDRINMICRSESQHSVHIEIYANK